jgi:copper chaperone
MLKSISLNVTGMKCGGCEINAKNKLEAFNGITEVRVSYKDNKIEIDYESETTSEEAMIGVITEAGYKVTS